MKCEACGKDYKFEREGSMSITINKKGGLGKDMDFDTIPHGYLWLGKYLAKLSDKEYNQIVNVEKKDKWPKKPGDKTRK